MQQEFLDGKVVVKVGDITRENVNAIVNSANSTLLSGIDDANRLTIRHRDFET